MHSSARLTRSSIPPIVQDAMRAPSRPLDRDMRASMETRFAHDFSRVRVHTDDVASRSAHALHAHAYTFGNDVVFARGRFDPATEAGRRLIAHELTHVVEQASGPREVARQPADAPLSEEQKEKATAKEAKPKPPKCHTGCAMRWGQDTTCSKWGFVESTRDPGDNVQKWKRWKATDFQCCNSWPFALERYARSQLGLNGAASSLSTYQKQIATVSMGEREVQVLCSDTIPGTKFGETKAGPGACTGPIDNEVIELSPKAMEDLSGQITSPLHVKVCYTGAAQDLCLHNGPGKASFPEATHCMTRGCQTDPDLPKLKDTGWPRV
jgi:hypothetical protein